MKKITDVKDLLQQTALVLLIVSVSVTEADQVCHGSGQAGDPLLFDPISIPCDGLHSQDGYDFTVLLYPIYMPVAPRLYEESVAVYAYVDAFSTSENGTNSTRGVQTQMAFAGGQNSLGYGRYGTCYDEGVFPNMSAQEESWVFMDSSSCSLQEEGQSMLESCPNMTLESSLPGDYSRLYVGVKADPSSSCDEVHVQVALQDAEDHYRFSSRCFEPFRCHETPTPSPTFYKPPPPPDDGICEFDETYTPYSSDRYPIPGNLTFQPLEVDCPAVNESVVVWFDIQMPLDPNGDTTYAQVSLAASLVDGPSLSTGFTLHGWSNDKKPRCDYPSSGFGGFNDGTVNNIACVKAHREKLCYGSSGHGGEGGSIQRIFGIVNNTHGGCQGRLRFEAAVVDKSIDNADDLSVYERASCFGPLQTCREGQALPVLPQQITSSPTISPTRDPDSKPYCWSAHNDTIFVVEPLILNCPPHGESIVAVFELLYPTPNETLVPRVQVEMAVSYGPDFEETSGLNITLKRETFPERDPFPHNSTCDDVPYFYGKQSGFVESSPYRCHREFQGKLCITTAVQMGYGRHARYYLNVLNDGGQCQPGQPMRIEALIHNHYEDSSPECLSDLRVCSSAPAPTASPTWYRPPAPPTDVCDFDPEYAKYGRGYPNTGLSTYKSLVVPCQPKLLTYFDFRMPVEGGNHHLVATALDVAVTPTNGQGFSARINIMPDFLQSQVNSYSCDTITEALRNVTSWDSADRKCDELQKISSDTVCYGTSYNSYQGSIIRLFVEAWGACTGGEEDEVRFDAMLSDISIAGEDIDLDFYQFSTCTRAITLCATGETIPKMPGWEVADSSSNTPAATPSSAPSTPPVELAVTRETSSLDQKGAADSNDRGGVKVLSAAANFTRMPPILAFLMSSLLLLVAE